MRWRRRAWWLLTLSISLISICTWLSTSCNTQYSWFHESQSSSSIQSCHAAVRKVPIWEKTTCSRTASSVLIISNTNLVVLTTLQTTLSASMNGNSIAIYRLFVPSQSDRDQHLPLLILMHRSFTGRVAGLEAPFMHKLMQIKAIVVSAFKRWQQVNVWSN